MDCSKPGFPVLHHLPEFAQIVSMESVKPSSLLILWCPLLFLPSTFPGIRGLLVGADGIWLPYQGSHPGPLHWEHGVLATGPPGKSLTPSLFLTSSLSLPSADYWDSYESTTGTQSQKGNPAAGPVSPHRKGERHGVRWSW